MKRSDELLNNTIIIGIGTISTKLLSFLLVPFYTMWLSPEEYGNFDLLVTYISFIIPFITFQLEQAIFRFSFNKRLEAKKYLDNALYIVMLNMIICNIIIYCIMKSKEYCFSYALYFSTYAIYNCLSEYLRGTEKLKFYSLNNILVSVFIVIFNIIFVYVLKLQVNGMLMSFGISYLIGILIIILKEEIFDSKFFKSYNKNIQKSMIIYSLPLIPNSVSWWITNVSDRTIIKIFLGSFYNGIYAIACKIPIVINLIFNIFNLSWQQTAIKTVDASDKKIYYNKIYNKLITFLFSSGFCILSITPLIFNVFISNEYSSGMIQIPLLLNGVIFLSLAQFLSGILLANMDTKSVGTSTTIAAVINLIINLVFIKKIGLIAASLSTCISYIVLFLIRYIKLKHILHSKKTTYKIIIYNVIFILISCFIFINNWLLNSVLVFISILLFIIANRDIEELLISKIFGRKYNEGINN